MATSKSSRTTEKVKNLDFLTAKLNNMRLDAGVTRSAALWARYEGACEALRWLGYKITIEGGKHRVEPC